MPDLSKTASAAIAALVVATAATVASLASSGAAGPGASVTTASSTSSAAPDGATTRSATAKDGRRPTDPGGHVALFLGRSAELKPRGGVAKSFTCRAVVRLSWGCHVREGAAPVVPATLAADVVVVVLVPEDDATRVARLLDRLPARLRGARLVLLGPIAAAGSPVTPTGSSGAAVGAAAGSPAARQSAALRRLAAARGGLYLDPIARQWIPSASRGALLMPDGERLTPAGRTQVTARLAEALGELAV